MNSKLFIARASPFTRLFTLNYCSRLPCVCSFFYAFRNNISFIGGKFSKFLFHPQQQSESTLTARVLTINFKPLLPIISHYWDLWSSHHSSWVGRRGEYTRCVKRRWNMKQAKSRILKLLLTSTCKCNHKNFMTYQFFAVYFFSSLSLLRCLLSAGKYCKQ